MGKVAKKTKKTEKTEKVENNVEKWLETLNRKRSLIKTRSFKALPLKRKFKVVSSSRCKGKYGDQIILILEDGQDLFR